MAVNHLYAVVAISLAALYRQHGSNGYSLEIAK